MQLNLFSDLELVKTTNQIYLFSSQSQAEDFSLDVVEINRRTKEIKLNKINKNILLQKEESMTIYGVLGFVKLVRAFYMIVITSRRNIGSIIDHDIYTLEDIKVISCDVTPDEIIESDIRYINMIKDHFHSCGFYFSYTIDLTRRLEKWVGMCHRNIFYSSLFEFNEKYMWNRYLLNRVIHIKEISRYFLPIVCGFVGIKDFSRPSIFSIVLISRRCNQRVGTRYFVRGVDDNGNTANYVESEILCITHADAFSMVQIRGSIPIRWSQYPTLFYKPKIKVYSVNHVLPMQKHFDKDINERGKEIVINLVDNKGDEAILSSNFQFNLSKLDIDKEKLQYLYFDFHKNCRGLDFAPIVNLLNTLDVDRVKMGYFHVSRDENTSYAIANVITRQEGVFRTNCIDCLDRTNVVQSMISWRTLVQILEQIGVNVTNYIYFTEIERIHKNLWADNADFLSIQYAGTPALKTDFTRTGVRTMRGMAMDGLNSVSRYFMNNFYDGYRQDCFDLVIGNFEFNSTTAESIKPHQRSLTDAMVPILFVSMIFLLIGDIFFLNTTVKSRFFIAALNLVGIFAAVRYILKRPNQYINLPSLMKLNSQ